MLLLYIQQTTNIWTFIIYPFSHCYYVYTSIFKTNFICILYLQLLLLPPASYLSFPLLDQSYCINPHKPAVSSIFIKQNKTKNLATTSPCINSPFLHPSKSKTLHTVVFKILTILTSSQQFSLIPSHFFHSSNQFVKKKSVKNRSDTFQHPFLSEIPSFGFYLFFIYLTSKTEHVLGFTSPYF